MGLTRIGANATLGQPIPPPFQSHPGTKRMRASVRYGLVLCAVVPTLLGAQGFGIYEQGTCAMGRAGAGVAAPCSDRSAMFFNPAGLAGLTGGRVTVGVTLIDIQGGFTDDVFQQHTSLDDPLIGVPQLYVSYGATSKLGIGLGTDFADAHLEATKPTVAAHFGATFKVNERLSLGANFLTQAKFDYSGTATFTQVPTNLVVPADLAVGALTIPAGTPIDLFLNAPPLSLFDPTSGVFKTQPVTTTIKNPSQLVLGVAYKVANGWTLLGDYQLTWWSQFNELDITFPQDLSGALDRHLFERYQNTSGFRFGAEWAKDAKWTLRGGYLHHDGGAPAETV